MKRVILFDLTMGVLFSTVILSQKRSSSLTVSYFVNEYKTIVAPEKLSWLDVFKNWLGCFLKTDDAINAPQILKISVYFKYLCPSNLKECWKELATLNWLGFTYLWGSAIGVWNAYGIIQLLRRGNM